MRALLIGLFVSAAIVVDAAASPALQCGGPLTGGSGTIGETDHTLVPITAKEFGERYGGIAKQTFGSVEVRAALVPIPDPPAEANPRDRLVRAGFATGGKFYELQGDLEVSDEDSRSDRLPSIEVADAGDGSLPLLRLSWTATLGGRAPGTESETVFLDFRGQPRVAYGATCSNILTVGACTAHDGFYAVHESFDCGWDLLRADLVCTQARTLDANWTHRAATRRFAIFHGNELPATERILPSLEALARGPRGEHFVEGIGLVKPAGTIAHRWFLYAATGTGHALALRLWSVDLHDPKGPIVRLPVQLLDDGLAEEEALAPDDVAGGVEAEKDALRYTPGALPFAIRTKRLTAGGPVDVLQLVLHDGRGRGLFWIGGDAASGVLSALRVSSEAGEYAHCGLFLRPAAASRAEMRTNPLSAMLRIEPHWLGDLDGGLVGPDRHHPYCPLAASVTWAEGGFRVGRKTLGCNKRRQRAVVKDDGTLAAADVEMSKNQ